MSGENCPQTDVPDLFNLIEIVVSVRGPWHYPFSKKKIRLFAVMLL